MNTPSPSWDQPPDVYTPSALRALRAEERRFERTRIRDILTTAALAADQHAADLHSRRADQTSPGRRAAALRMAVELLDEVEPEPGTLWSQVIDQDTVSVYRYDGDEDGPDPNPVRIVVHDSVDLATAVAYVSLDDAEQHARDVLQLAAEIRNARDPQDARTVFTLVCSCVDGDATHCPLHTRGIDAVAEA